MSQEVVLKEVPVKLGDIIKEKKHNFNLFLIKNITQNNRIPEDKKAEINKFIDTLSKVNLDQFIFFIQNELIKYKGRTKVYVDNLLIQYDIKEIDIEEQELDKFGRYIELFIKLVE